MERYKKIDLDLLLNPLFHGPHEELKGMQCNTPQYYEILRDSAFSHTCPECESEHEDETHVTITAINNNFHKAKSSKNVNTAKEKKKSKHKRDKANLVPEIIYYKDDEEVDDVRGSFEAFEPVFVVNQLPKLRGTTRSNSKRKKDKRYTPRDLSQ